MLQQIFQSRNGFTQSAIGVIQFRRSLQRKIAFEFAGAHEIIGMQFPAENVELPFQSGRFNVQLLREAEKSEIVPSERQRLNFPASRAEMSPGYRAFAIPTACNRHSLSAFCLWLRNAHGCSFLYRDSGTKYTSRPARRMGWEKKIVRTGTNANAKP